MSKSVVLLIIVVVFVLSGCSDTRIIDTVKAESISVSDVSEEKSEETPESTIEITPKPTIKPTLEPTDTPVVVIEEFDYIDDLAFSMHFETLFTSNWRFENKTDPFVMNGNTYDKGLGMFIRSKNIKGDRGTVNAAWNLNKMYHRISFDMGCEQSFGYDIEEKYGKYKIQIIADGKEIWDSGYRDYKYVLENIEIVIVENCERLELKLTQYKGTNGTLNVVLGNFRLYKNSES
ncbi:MAG: NPCBM/NEW2 domain-containing protein [Clostridiales bacterium]|nr:NPCBM/NEW2 domain-containing protein [Clostridiales bacterium]